MVVNGNWEDTYPERICNSNKHEISFPNERPEQVEAKKVLQGDRTSHGLLIRVLREGVVDPMREKHRVPTTSCTLSLNQSPATCRT